ncbi:MAG: hypothetical protein R2697_02850 [Ilumatobacteraceae bacterium]
MTGTPLLADLFASDPGRADRYVVDAADLRIDYSKHPITDELLAELLDRARAAGVEQRRDAMFAGEHINVTEDRAVLHTALRAPRDAVVEVDGENVVPAVHEVLGAMSTFAERVRADDRITDVVNIGIGGSDLGPAMAAQALAAFGHPRLTCHFVSNVDGADIHATLQRVEPSSTLSHRRLEDVRHHRDPHQRAYGAGLAGRRVGRRRGCRPFRRRLDQRRAGGRVRDRHGEHVRVLGLGGRPLLGRLGDRSLADDPDRTRRVP